MVLQELGTIVSNKQYTDRLFVMEIKVPNIPAAVQPGQFFHLLIPGMEDHMLRRPFSVFNVNIEASTLSVLYQVVGYGSKRMTQLEPGVEVDLMGPIGNGWKAPEGTKRALLVAGGVGGAPLFMHAQELVHSGVNVEVVLGAQTKDALVVNEAYTELLGREPRISTDDGSYGRAGFCTSLVEEALASEEYDYVACCGPEPLMRIVSNMALEAGVSAAVSLEKRMACGIGACLGCIVETVHGRKRSCVDGPVFNAAEVIW